MKLAIIALSTLLLGQTLGGPGVDNPIRVKEIVPQWDDLRVAVGNFRPNGQGNDPSTISWASKPGLSLIVFQADDEFRFEAQMPHRYKEGTDLLLHIHWTCHDRCNEEVGNSVPWKIDLVKANVNGVFGSVETYDLSDPSSAAIDNTHIIAEAVTVSGVGLNISHMIIGRAYRDGTGSWVGTSAAQSPALLELDFHYQIESAGSDGQFSK